MQATKNRNAFKANSEAGMGNTGDPPVPRFGLKAICLTALAFVLAGCTPAGPRALLDGKALLDQGHYQKAVEKLTLATSLMATNAQAWNYLGLACHQAGDAARAAKAYRRALDLNRELFEAHYNLGCLWLEQNKPDVAKSEFTACTLRRADSVEAWLKLGIAQCRLTESAAAAESFQKVLRLSPNHPEAFNGLGLVSAQRKRPREAAQYFNLALKQQANYRPALLNLATVLHRDLNDPLAAARKYREYLGLQPRAADWDTVNSVLQSLEVKPIVAPHAAVTNPPPQIAAKTNAPKPPPVTATVPVKSNPPPAIALIPMKSNPPPANALAVVKSNPPPALAQPAPAPATTTVEVVQLPPETEIRTTPLEFETQPQPATVATSPAVVPAPDEEATPQKSAKRGFFARLNPFRRDPRPATKTTPLPAATTVTDTPLSDLPSEPASSAPRVFSRYTYLAPPSPTPGDRTTADAAFAKGRQAELSRKLEAAAQAYQQAAEADGSYFEAHYNLALVQYSLRDYPRALATWEKALAIRPDSAEGRYMFALTLNAAGFAPDAVLESEKVLAANTNDARAHLILGNLYAEQLRDKARARVHYQRVLELDSRHPNATQIRYWLVANPA